MTHTSDRSQSASCPARNPGRERYWRAGRLVGRLNRESVRTLQNGAQTALAYTPGGEVDHHTDLTGKTDYTWDAAGRLDYLIAPDGKKTDFDYDNNDKHTKAVYPGGATQ